MAGTGTAIPLDLSVAQALAGSTIHPDLERPSTVHGSIHQDASADPAAELTGAIIHPDALAEPEPDGFTTRRAVAIELSSSEGKLFVVQ